MNQKNSNETSLYYIGWTMLTLSFIIWLFYQIDPFNIKEKLSHLPCVLNYLTGLYCPGCGGTRACILLVQGKVIKSFIYHPLVIYGAIIGGWFMMSQSMERLSKGKFSIGMRYKDIYLWIALVIVVINFIIKNILLFCGIDLLKIV